MKKISVYLAIVAIAGCSVFGSTSAKKESRLHFSVKDSMVYYDGKLIAKYQAKTFSLDGGELVEEYNLLMVDHTVEKQRIGDLIDFISERHQGAEVEVEIEPNGIQFKL